MPFYPSVKNSLSLYIYNRTKELSKIKNDNYIEIGQNSFQKKFKTVKSTNIYEIRLYNQRIILWFKEKNQQKKKEIRRIKREAIIMI